MRLPTPTSRCLRAWRGLERFGYAAQRQRWLYHFRNRHGFTDVADAAFERLWNAPSLTWSEIVALSDGAIAHEPVA